MEGMVGVRSAATAATARAVCAVFWNPHATQRVSVVEVSYAVTAATAANLSITRATARGTATTTTTPGIDNDFGRSIAPPSGVVVDTAWSAAPTIVAGDLFRWNTPAATGAGMVEPFPRELIVPPGTGLAIITPVAAIFPASDINFHWIE